MKRQYWKRSRAWWYCKGTKLKSHPRQSLDRRAPSCARCKSPKPESIHQLQKRKDYETAVEAGNEKRAAMLKHEYEHCYGETC